MQNFFLKTFQNLKSFIEYIKNFENFKTFIKTNFEYFCLLGTLYYLRLLITRLEKNIVLLTDLEFKNTNLLLNMGVLEKKVDISLKSVETIILNQSWHPIYYAIGTAISLISFYTFYTQYHPVFSISNSEIKETFKLFETTLDAIFKRFKIWDKTRFTNLENNEEIFKTNVLNKINDIENKINTVTNPHSRHVYAQLREIITMLFS